MASPVVATTGATNSGGGTVTLAAPASISDGDLLIAVIAQQSGGSAAPGLSGWTVKDRYDNGDVILNWLWKRAASESGSYAFVSADAGYQTGCVLRITGAIASGDPFDVVGTGATGTSSTATANSVTTTVAETRLLWLAGFFLGATEVSSPPAGMSGTQGEAFYIGNREQTTAAATGTAAGTLNGSDIWSAWMAAIKPPAGGGGSASSNLMLLGVS